jgi:hypothetical protein
MRIPRYVFALAFIAALGAMVIMMVVTARGYGEAARTMPLVVGIPTIVFILVQLVSDGVRVARGDATVGTTSEEEQDRYLHGAKSEGVQRASVPTAVSSTREDRSTSMLGAMLWVGALATLIWLAGMLIAIPVFVSAFMRVFGRERWPVIAAFAVGTTLAVYLFFVVVLEVRLHPGLFGDLLAWL